ncbi:MAG: hypothetical protein ACYC99_12730 [Candidatus Geothermincolia bacterium]
MPFNPARATSAIVVVACLILCGLFLSVPAAAAGAYEWTGTGGGVATFTSNETVYDIVHNVLYAACNASGTGKGVWCCSNPGTAPVWTKISTGGDVGDMSFGALTYDTVRDVLYAGRTYEGGAVAGVWRCGNPSGAHNWVNISTGSLVDTYGFAALAVDVSRNILYAAESEDYISGTGKGVLRCTSPTTAPAWAQIGTGAPLTTRPVLSLFYNQGSNQLYAGAYTDGVWRCTTPNGAASWTSIGQTGMPMVIALAYDSARDVLYTSGWNEGVRRCTNPGGTSRTWTNISSAGNVGSARAYALCYDSTDNALYLGGATTLKPGVWRCDTPNATPSWWDTGGGVATTTISSLAIDVTGRKLYAGTYSNGVWAAPIPPVFPDWYLAEGTTAWGFSSRISIENPNSTAVKADVTYMTSEGKVTGPVVNLPAMSQATVNPADTLGQKDFSTFVSCEDRTKTICVDRTMIWNSGYGNGSAEHSSVGVNAPAMKWYLPEGSSAWGFECWLLIQNPNAAAATCNVTYMIEGGSPVTKPKTIPANSRSTFNMADDIGSHDASIMVESTNVPVIPERAMYQAGPGMPAGNRREGHDSIGTTEPANDYYLAEGTTAWGFTTYVLVQNPNDATANVTVTYNTSTGAVADEPFSMPAKSRKTIRVNDRHPNLDLSTWVHGDKSIIAERSMYWEPTIGSGMAMHDSIGMKAPHKTFYLPDGEVFRAESDSLTETYTLVQNPSSVDVTVKISYLTPSGTNNVSFTDTVPKNSRKTYNMGDKTPTDTRAAVLVECQTADGSIMVERAMYFQNRWGGTDTIGGYSD